MIKITKADLLELTKRLKKIDDAEVINITVDNNIIKASTLKKGNPQLAAYIYPKK